MIRLWHHLFHPFHVLRFGLDQPLHIVLRGRLNGSRPLAEMTPKPTTKGQEAPTHPDQQAALFCSCGRVFFTASGEISFIGLSHPPCLVIQIGLCLFININQKHKSDKVELSTAKKAG
jgi:hypothetical protein